LTALLFNKCGLQLAKLTAAVANYRKAEERHMQTFFVVELVLMFVVMLTVGVRNIEQELRRKPFRYDDTD
jgi:hypothetical protein